VTRFGFIFVLAALLPTADGTIWVAEKERDTITRIDPSRTT